MKGGEGNMDKLLALSDELAAAVERAGRAVVAVHGRPRVPSTGVHWHSGLIVTAKSVSKEAKAWWTLNATVDESLAVPPPASAAPPSAPSRGRSFQAASTGARGNRVR